MRQIIINCIEINNLEYIKMSRGVIGGTNWVLEVPTIFKKQCDFNN